MTCAADDLPAFTRHALGEIRARTPLVQCLTNAVVTNFTANVLLALGAAPAMVDIPQEAGPFAKAASGVLVNLGTPHGEQRAAMLEAVEAAAAAGTPWVLDPVAVGSLPVRTALAHRLLDGRPAVIRGNASEIIALAGDGSGGRGVDATDAVESAAPAAGSLARSTGAVVAVSGPVDLVTVAWATCQHAQHGPALPGLDELRATVEAGWFTSPHVVARAVALDQARLLADTGAHQLHQAALNPGVLVEDLVDTGHLITTALRHTAAALPADAGRPGRVVALPPFARSQAVSR